MIIRKLKTPYPAIDGPIRQLIRAFLFGGFVFLFLFAFQPFGLSMLPSGILRISAAYGLITTVIMLCMNIVAPIAFRILFDESKWTIGKEIVWTLLNIIVIALANLWYTHAQGFIQMSIYGFFVFSFYTIAVGLFPVTGLILWRAARLHKNFSSTSEAISNRLKHNFNSESTVTENPESNLQLNENDPIHDFISIQGEGESEAIQVRRDALLYLKSSGNYVEIYFEVGASRRRVIRATLKSMAKDLEEYQEFFRCHKQYIVNLNKVERVSGNAQGLKIQLYRDYAEIPVSRALTAVLKEKLSGVLL